MAENEQNKGTLLSETVKDGENISACGHATDLVQYSERSYTNIGDSPGFYSHQFSVHCSELGAFSQTAPILYL